MHQFLQESTKNLQESDKACKTCNTKEVPFSESTFNKKLEVFQDVCYIMGVLSESKPEYETLCKDISGNLKEVLFNE